MDEFSALFLLENGADVNMVCDRRDGETALHLAAKSADMTRVAETLLGRGAKVNAQNRNNL